MSKVYQEGLHILATLKDVALPLLQVYDEFQIQLQALVHQHDLQDLGAVYHNFEGGGFTAVLCIHTWPEYALLNLDIYLSNFSRVNDGAVQQIFESLHRYFGGTVHNLIEAKR